ncbi:hypothetical protein JTE90_012387 [Oedothorax gibbosus]|uniref:CCHC-type domain-containing protein n=1 Tax=Oedothorax gibbosus TaxID=931172 RepID=A0AAV6TWU8_9ARAC|nr:hypothetical protein JTE90_012387 [Oedothorax gibbosus]
MDGSSQTEQMESRVMSSGAPETIINSHTRASTSVAKPNSNKGQKKSKGKNHQAETMGPKPSSRSVNQDAGINAQEANALPPKVTSLDQDRSPTPQTLAVSESQGESLGGNQTTTSQADASQQPQVEIPYQSKRSDNAQTHDSERSFAEVAGWGPSCPRGPIQVKSTAPSSNSGSSGRDQVKPGNDVKRTRPYIREVLVVGPLGNTSSSKLPFRYFMWNLLDTNGLGKPAHARSTLAGGLVLFLVYLQSLDALEEALGRDDFRERISVRRSCGNSRKPQIKICDMEDIDFEVERNKILREIEVERNLPNVTLRFVFKYSRDSKERRSDWVLEVDPRYWVNVRTLKFFRFRWGRHAVFEFLDLNQCNRCFAFGHGSKRCSKKPLCKRCG